MNYNDVRNDVEYGFQEMTCQSVEAAWSNWGAWGRCSQSCDGGVTRRTRSCVSQGIVVDVLAGDPGCGCPGSSFEEQVCNTFCCPVWQICTADDCGNDDWTPLSAAADGAFAFGACPECGDTTLELTRHCKCREPDGRFRFGDLTTPAFSTTFANFQHDCPLAVGEVVENSFAGIAYIAKTSKVCDGPCCEGWQPWSEWGACDDSCFDSNNGALTAPAVARTQTRNRNCGCEGTTEVATDFSNCPSLDGLTFLPAETEIRACTAEPSPCAYWAEWGAYSACSATCRAVLYDGTAAVGARCTADPQDAGGLQVRERVCNFGDVGAAGCPETDRTESQACVLLSDCCQYDQWSLWSQCLTDVGESCSANGQPGKTLALLPMETFCSQENERASVTLSVAILSFATIAITWKSVSFPNAQRGPSGECGPSAACLVVQEQSQEHETAAVTSSDQVKNKMKTRKRTNFQNFRCLSVQWRFQLCSFPVRLWRQHLLKLLHHRNSA